MTVTTRPANRDDLPTLLTFEQGIIEAERPYDHTLRPDPISYYDIGELIDADDAEVIVAELDGELVGSGHVTKKLSRHYVQPSYHAYIGFLYVLPAHRGKGINKNVLDALHDWARRNNLPEVHLTVYPGNDPAIRAYQKAGYAPYILEMRLNLEE